MNIAYKILEATEKSAIAASQWIGSGLDKCNNADNSATIQSKKILNQIPFYAKVIIGEGIKDNAPGLLTGDLVGQYVSKDIHTHRINNTNYELAADVIDGTKLTVNGLPGAISVIVISLENSIYETNNFYQKKIVYNKTTKKYLWKNSDDDFRLIRFSIKEIVDVLCMSLNKTKNDLTICLLDRPRNQKFIDEFRKCGCRLQLISDGDITNAISVCIDEYPVDLLYGIGGAPEGVISSSAIKGLGGGIEVYDVDKNFKMKGKILNENDLVSQESVFCATGITSGQFLKGVKISSDRMYTNSVMINSHTKEIRWFNVEHKKQV
mgnify:FL=1